MDERQLLERITVNPQIFGGKPIIRGRRLAVEHILGMLAAGDSAEIILEGYPWLEPEDIQACLVLKAKRLCRRGTMIDNKERLQMGYASDMAQVEVGPVTQARLMGRGPAIWLAGDPADLKQWMDLGAAGIVTNTVVLNQMVKKYGPVQEVVKRYLDITDKPVVVEIDGRSTQELLDVGHIFTRMSDQVMLKIPCTTYALGAFRALSEEGIETFCTTVFSLTQAAAVAQTGADHVLPFCEPVKEMGGDPTKLVRECMKMFSGWEQRPFIMAALVRSPETAYAALRDGADEIVIFWPVFRDMMEHPLTTAWNKTFMDEWEAMDNAGMLEGLPVVRQ